LALKIAPASPQPANNNHKMQNYTDRFSFVLKPLGISGIGVFATHDITEGAHMEVFLPDFEEEVYDEKDIPEELRGYCLDREHGKILCPKFFNRMDIGNYLNHSAEKANLRYEKGKGYFAARDIRKGEELFADYRQLGEPEENWGKYYQHKDSHDQRGNN
jgi:SET domain-containing protein